MCRMAIAGILSLLAVTLTKINYLYEKSTSLHETNKLIKIPISIQLSFLSNFFSYQELLFADTQQITTMTIAF